MISRFKVSAHAPSLVVLFVTTTLLLLAPVALAQKPGANLPSAQSSSSVVQLVHADTGSQSATFFPVVTYGSGGGGPFSFAIADVNGDGIPDILVTNCGAHATCSGLIDGVVGVLLGNGDGTFKPAVSYKAGGTQTIAVAVADVNKDGKPDLVVGNSFPSDTVGVLLGNGDGTFQSVRTMSSGGGGITSVAVADVNGDGNPDILVANQSSCPSCTSVGLVGVLLGDGKGGFLSATTYSSGGYQPTALAVADLNGDGKFDVAVTNGCGGAGDCSGEATVGVLLGNGNGTFQTAVSYGSGGQGPSLGALAIADVDGDGKLDLLVANSNCSAVCAEGAIGVLLGKGDGTFRTAVLYGTGVEETTSVSVADVNRDGKPDLLVSSFCSPKQCKINSSGTVGVLQGNGDGSFQTAVNYSSGGKTDEVFAPAGVDMNGDGLPDIIVVNVDGGVGLFLNNTGMSQGSTTTTLTSTPNPSMSGLAVKLIANVNSPSGTPTGKVMFLDGSTWLGVGTVINGTADLSVTTLSIGAHSVIAQYQGTTGFSTSVSSVLNQVVNKRVYTSKTVVATSGTPSIVGQPVTFTATVTSTGGAIPDGETITFYDGSNEIGRGNTAGGVASLTTSSLSAKTHTIKAVYPGDPTFETSKGVVTQVVEN